MSVCDEGWGELKICPACNFVDCRRTVPRPECVRPDNQPAGGANLHFCRYRKLAPCAVSEELPDSCNLAPLLKALPDASEEQIRLASAVLEDRYSHVPNEDKGYTILAIQTDKPCPTCDGEDILINVSGDRFSPPTIPCPTCGGSKWMSSEWDSEVPVPCPDCRGKHFIPGKGRGM